jgi:hypothetical protein
VAIQTKRYVRNPLYVDAVQVTEENFKELAQWCMGDVQNDGTKDYIRVRVHTPKSARQTMAFVGDWILYSDKGYKIYSNRSFLDTFTPEEVKTP